MMLKDLEGFRGSSRRPWLVIVGVVILCTLAGIWGIRRLESRAAPPDPAAAAAGGATAATATPTTGSTALQTPANRDLPPDLALQLALAQADEQADRLVEARTNYLALVERPDCGSARSFIESRLAAVNVALVTTPRAMPGKIDYAIRAGDSIKVLARRHGSTAELIIRGNRITNPDRIQIGDRLRILDNPAFAIVVRKTANDLLLTLDGAFFKRYTVGTGMYGRTPVGTFRVQDKIENPPWWRPDGGVVPFGDPENILGTRWMSLAATGETPPARGYGIHGTWEVASLGKQSSAGCVRMANGDVEELFMLVPEGTPVTITD
jgi:lipoprotein-anchoring transpeptidase ErfK/SrfK